MNMTDRLDIEIRRALTAEANAVEVPADLAARTLEAAEDLRPTWVERVGGWRDARAAAGDRGYATPRWAYAAALAGVVAVLVGLSAVGLQVTEDTALAPAPTPDDAIDAPAGDGDLGGAATSGAVTSGMTARPAGTEPANTGSVTQAGGSQLTGVESPGAKQVAPTAGAAAYPPHVVRTAELAIEVARGRFEAAWDRVHGIAASAGGFVASASREQDSGHDRATVSLRVPADRTDETLAALRRLGTLRSLNSSSSDVSGQLVDLDAQLRAAQTQEAALLELMGRTDEISEILDVRTRLDAVRAEIERTQAQRERLRERVSMSEISVTMHEHGTDPGDARPDGPLPRAWRQALDASLAIFAGLVVVTGFLVPFAFVGFLLWLAVRIVRGRSL